MHVHLPEPLHGRREFVGEVGIIVIGVLIALGAEQLPRRWSHRNPSLLMTVELVCTEWVLPPFRSPSQEDLCVIGMGGGIWMLWARSTCTTSIAGTLRSIASSMQCAPVG